MSAVLFAVFMQIVSIVLAHNQSLFPYAGWMAIGLYFGSFAVIILNHVFRL